MRHLFLRIFVPILLALLLAFGVGFYLADLFRPTGGGERGSGRGPGRSTWFDSTREQVQQLHAHLSQDDLESARSLLKELGNGMGRSAYVLDEEGNEILGQKLDQRHLRFLNDRGPHGPRRLRRNGPFLHYYEHVASLSDRSYLILIEVDTRGWLSMRRLTMHLVQFGSAAFALAIASLLLARSMTSPVLKLRDAVKRFTEGDLERRIGPAFGQRRDELAALARDFDTMAGRISGLLEAQRRLLRDVSHELRSPLARQAVAIELVRQRIGDDSDNSSLKRVEREHARLIELVDELLTLTKLEGTPEAVAREPIALSELMGEIVDDARFEGSQRGIGVTLRDESTGSVLGVREVLRRAFENIIRNGVAYSGGKVTVEMDMAGEHVRTRVTDFGNGVPEDELQDVLKPFYRTSSARDRQSGGVGLGLAIADRAIRWHGGTIDLRNKPGAGLEVTVILPIAADSRREQPPNARK